MPLFAEAFGYTPREFRSLSYSDFTLLVDHLQRKADAIRRAGHGH